jgi:hypothetical protein
MLNPLYNQVCSWDNLREAHRKASRGKRGKTPAARFELRLADNLLELCSRPLSRLLPAPVYFFRSQPPSRGRPR